jgi:hypothetical protein
MRRLALLWICASACHQETTYEDVQPILERRCNSCHVDGVSTYQPYFKDYESVAPLRRILLDTVASRHMPPFAMDNTGACGDAYFADEGLWLSDLEIQTISDWVVDGVPRGTPVDRDELEHHVEQPLSHVDRSVGIGHAYVYSGLDPMSQHRCFVVDPEIQAPTVVTGFEVEPGNRFAVQSVSVFALDDSETRAAAAALDEQSPSPGYACFGGASIPGARFVGSWVWGRSAVHFPEGTGIPLVPTSRLVMQIHYNSTGGALHPEPGETRLHLQLDATAEPASYLTLAARGFSLWPGTQEPNARGFIEVDRGARILAVAPLMHHGGKSMRIERVRPFSSTCVAAAPHWEMYNHMRLYRYATPAPEVFAGDRLDIACTFQPPNRLTVDGEHELNEQCLARLYVVPR